MIIYHLGVERGRRIAQPFTRSLCRPSTKNMDNQEKIANLLKFYFRTVFKKAGLRWDNDNDSEMEELAKLITN